MNTQAIRAALEEARKSAEAKKQEEAKWRAQRLRDEQEETRTLPARATAHAATLMDSIPGRIQHASTRGYRPDGDLLYSKCTGWSDFDDAVVAELSKMCREVGISFTFEKKPASGMDQFDGPCVGDEGEFQIFF